MSLFAIVIILLVLFVGFFHLVQGFFSATISAIVAVVAAVLAVSYHEAVVEKYLPGKMPDSMNAVVLIFLFAVLYLVPRILFDSLIPGNIRLPPMIDKVGSVVMGLIAGVFATGVLAIAAQELPFKPSVWGYSRFPIEDRSVRIPIPGKNIDRTLFDSLAANSYEEAKPNGQTMLLPVDDIVLGTVRRLSEGGSLAGDRPLSAVHPDWLTELFAQRAGIEAGAKRVSVNLPNGTEEVKLDGVYQFDVKDAVAKNAVKVMDAEVQGFRTTKLDVPKGDAAHAFVVARVLFTAAAADKVVGMIRVSPGTVRLVTKSTAGGSDPHWVEYRPFATLDGVKTLFLQKPDDFLFLNDRDDKIPGDERGIDFVFYVEAAGFIDGGAKALAGGKAKIADGSFLEVKRQVRFDLAGKDILKDLKPNPQVAVIRKAIAGQAPNEIAAPSKPSSSSGPPPTAATPPPAAGQGGPVSAVGKKLVGDSWETVSGNSKSTWTFSDVPPRLTVSARGLVGFTTEIGTWREVSSKDQSVTIHADLKNEKNEPKPRDLTITFDSDNHMVMRNTDGSGEPTSWDRKPQ